MESSKRSTRLRGRDLSAYYDEIVRSTDELPYETLSWLGLKVVKPGEDSKIALGFPTPMENSDPHALEKYGLKKSDRFVGFSSVGEAQTASAEIERSGASLHVDLPVSERRFTTYELVLNPKPGRREAEAFRRWEAGSP